MEILPFAKTSFRGSDHIFGIRQDDRRRHMYLVGKTGTGKTTLLRNMAIQDVKEGRGIAAIDPHGEFVDFLLRNIPSSRINDVVYFNPADTDYPIGFNILESSNPEHKHLIASGLMGIFTKIWANVWSARMEYILNNAILALVEMPGSTLLGINRMLVDEDYRNKVIAYVKDPVVRSFWTQEYERWSENFRNEAIAPIQNKVGQFLSTPLIRNLVGQSKSTINLEEIMNTGKILLVNVSKGMIGEDNSSLLGSMIVTKLQLATMERVRLETKDYRDFYLYVDEFQNFVTDSFASILSESRKYRLNLIVAHQYIAQLINQGSTTVRDAVFGNVGTMVCFRVGAEDATFLEPEFEPEFVAHDLVNLPNFNTYVKLMINGVTERPFSATVLPPFQSEGDEKNFETVIKVSRERYARPRQEAETRIARWAGIETETDTTEQELKDIVLASGTRQGKVVKKRKLFQTICTNCKRTALVPFKPKEGIPVFCDNCMKTVGKGKPLREKPEAKRDVDLSGLENILGKPRDSV
ncbi:MAG: type IV secretion system DNA-binding domain-containing protein [Candidatus Colwellbacteria bacterium]|nr:type IV secretion system DNA-binding domain-containing protein [Candidatus Colwellbacteria bacterium]